MFSSIRAAIFDLDGVIVDTAKYHFLAWERLAKELGFVFTQEDNERLKGVSRMQSLDILLEVGGLEINQPLREELATKKNNRYVDYIHQLQEDEILPGAKDYILKLKEKGIKIALGSASKNAQLILERLHIQDLFDTVVDGNDVTKTKPDPEVFLIAAQRLGVPASECVVYEDAKAGIEAAITAGMKTVGIGDVDILGEADMVVAGLFQLL